MKVRRAILACWLAASAVARADSHTGAAWAVRFNKPDQNTMLGKIWPEEYAIRDAFLARINALGSNDWGCLATFTFSGNTAESGAAGPILAAMSNALARGAKLAFVADNGVNTTSNYWPGVSLNSLAARPGNALQLSRAPSDSGIMHNKTGVFWYRARTQAWVLTGSWNYTGGASAQQWNVLAEIQNNALGGAYSNEMREMLSGRFHAHAGKSHAHDGTTYRIAGTWKAGWVRFGPYPDGSVGGNNALTDIVGEIDKATNMIVFALNKLTRMEVANALIRACDRGVLVNGTIPKSDRTATNDASHAAWQALSAASNYATANRAYLYDAYASAARTNNDSGEYDLVHTKYMVIDPNGSAPMTIHGSANWTAQALAYTNMNDENVLFLPHAGMARAFVEQFNAMTDGVVPSCRIRTGGASTAQIGYWLPFTSRYEVVHTTNVFDLGGWTNRTALLPTGRGTNSILVTRGGERLFYRIRAVP